jgi:hypothetical protein
VPTTVTLPNDQTYTLPRARLYTATTLTTGDGWTPRPYLHVDNLVLKALPDIDTAQISDQIGEFARREPDLFEQLTADGWFDPLDLIRHYCKIEVLDKADNDTVLFTWYGKFLVDSRDLANDLATPANKTGQVVLTAYGLAIELEETFITGSRIQDAEGNPQTIGRGLTFNKYLGHAFPERANRTEFEVVDGEYEGYIFSWSPTTLVNVSSNLQAAKWTAAQAVRYLLNYHPPRKEDGEPTAIWSLLGIGDPTVEDYTDWYDITAETERRSVKAVIDELIPRQRLVGWWVEGREDEDADEFHVELKVFSFAESAIAMPGGATLEANGDQIVLEQGVSPIVQQPELRINAAVRANVVRTEGAYVTSTCTLRYDPDELGKGWTDVQEADYGLADSQGRERDALRDVYSRFIAADTWPMTIDDGNGNAMNVTLNYEDLPDEIENEDLSQLFLGVAEQGKWWFRGKRFLHHLAFKDENEYRRPLVVFEELNAAGEGTGNWILGEVVSIGGDGEREFNTQLRCCDETLGVRIIVNIPGGQHLIARGTFAGDVDDGRLDPDEAAGLSFDKMRVTGTVEWDDRVRIEERVDTPEGHDVVRLIQVPDARLDFLLPGTVTDVAEDGTLDTSEDGEVLRDDRDRLRAIAKAAAAWYGTPRNAITLPYMDVRRHLEIGQLITLLKQGTDEVAVNTPITGLAFDFLSGRTVVETSYADADFVIGA